MSITYHTLAELKQLALDTANAIGLATAYVSADADNAYNYATARCGFENPDSADADYYLKQHWLLEGMNLCFLYDVQRKYLLKFDVGDLRLGQISRMVRDMLQEREAALEKAKASSATAHLFVDAATYFGTMVVKSGIVDDAIGQSIDAEELE